MGAQHDFHRRRQLEWRSVLTNAFESSNQAIGRGIRDPHGGVTRAASGCQSEPRRGFFCWADAEVDRFAGRVGERTRAFGEHEPRASEPLWAVLHHPSGAKISASLFIGGSDKNDVAAQRDMQAVEFEKGEQLKDAERLHIEGATAPQIAVTHKAGEGVDGPKGATNGHDIHVIEEDQSRLGAVALQTSDDVAAARSGFGNLEGYSFSLENLCAPLRGESFITRRICSVDGDVCGKFLDSFVLESLPVRRCGISSRLRACQRSQRKQRDRDKNGAEKNQTLHETLLKERTALGRHRGLCLGVASHMVARKVFDHGAEDDEAVGGTEGGFDGALRMRHHAHHIALAIADASDCSKRAIRIGGVFDMAFGRSVTKNDLAIPFEFGERCRIAKIISFHVGDGDFQNLTCLRGAGERRVRVFDADIHVAADETQIAIAQHRAGEQARFKKNLKPVANAEHEAAAAGKAFDSAHDGRKARNGAGAEIVAESKTAGKNDDVAAGNLFGAMPEELDVLTKDSADVVICVIVAIRTGKHYDTEFHCAESPQEDSNTSARLS